MTNNEIQNMLNLETNGIWNEKVENELNLLNNDNKIDMKEIVREKYLNLTNTSIITARYYVLLHSFNFMQSHNSSF